MGVIGDGQTSVSELILTLEDHSTPTGLSNGDIESLRDEVRRVHPLRRYGTPDDVANLVNWLAGDEARYASGQLWVLDGGLTAQVQQMRL